MKRGLKIAIGAALAITVLAFVGSLTLPMKTVKITIDLPPPIKAKPAKPIVIVMETDGRLTIEGAPTTLDTLSRDLSTRFAGVPKDEQRVMIRAPGDVPCQRFMAVLNNLKGHGWNKIGLINEDLPTPKP
jgi:biopolymer transport protein ExbD